MLGHAHELNTNIKGEKLVTIALNKVMFHDDDEIIESYYLTYIYVSHSMYIICVLETFDKDNNM